MKLTIMDGGAAAGLEDQRSLSSEEPLTEAEAERLTELLDRLRQVRRESLYEEAALVWEYKEKRLYRKGGTWAERSRPDLDLDVSQADELCRIHEARLKILEISSSGTAPALPEKAYHWRPLVTDSPRIEDPEQLVSILQRAEELAGPGRAYRWAEVREAKDEILNRPKRSGYFPGMKKKWDASEQNEEGAEGEPEDGCGGETEEGWSPEHTEEEDGEYRTPDYLWDCVCYKHFDQAAYVLDRLFDDIPRWLESPSECALLDAEDPNWRIGIPHRLRRLADEIEKSTPPEQ